MLTPDQQEAFEERAAIMEFDGNLDRARAEELARADVLTQKDHDDPFDRGGKAH
jgi:hypothetical protein